METVGFVGLGTIGAVVARNIQKAGYAMVVHDIVPAAARPLVESGARLAASAAEVARDCRVVFTSLPGPREVEAVALGASGLVHGVRDGGIYVDLSSSSADLIRRVASEFAAHGARVMDAPLIVGRNGIANRSVQVLASGNLDTYNEVKPLLEDVGPKVTYVGGNGLAVSMKIAVNLSLAVQMLAFSEGVLLAEKSGISRKTAVEVLTNSVVASPMVQYRGPFVLGLPDEVWFSVNMMQKDMSLALEMGRELSVPLPTTAVTNEFLTAARGAGLSEKDFAALFHLLARLSGVSA